MRRFSIPFLFLFGLVVSGSSADALQPMPPRSLVEGHWQGTIVREGTPTSFLLDLRQHQGELTGSFSFPEQRVMEYPLEKVELVLPRLNIIGPGSSFKLEGTLSGDTIAGVFKDSTGEASFHVERAQPLVPYTSEEIRFSSGDATLAGSLYVPKGGGPFPAVVFLHGAGPEVRWGASRFFADYLARRGVAALIYDKRGTGESTGDWRKADFNDLASDVLAAISLLQSRPQIDAKKIGIYGHSQGGTIAPLIASKSTGVAFVISAAGAAIPMWQAEIHSLRTQVRAQGVSGESLARADEFAEQLVAVARTGKGFEELAAQAEAARRRGEPWAALLAPPPRDSYFWSFYPRIANYTAAEYWRKVRVPVLILQAGRDRYVPVEDSIQAMQEALREADNPDHTILLLPEAPHTFVLQPDSRNKLKWPRLYPGYSDLLLAWLRYRMDNASTTGQKLGNNVQDEPTR